jgi:hypothetical protein
LNQNEEVAVMQLSLATFSDGKVGTTWLQITPAGGGDPYQLSKQRSMGAMGLVHTGDTVKLCGSYQPVGFLVPLN